MADESYDPHHTDEPITLDMPPKRKNDSDELTARDRKKVKLATARTIEVQPTTESASADQNAVAGPSRLVTTDSELILCFVSAVQTRQSPFTRYENATKRN